MKKFVKRITTYISVVTVSFSSLLVLVVPKVSAAPVLWDGGGSDNNFSTAANWSSDIVPSDGDDLVSRNDSIAQNETYTNDLTNFAPRSFSFQKGTGTNYYRITIAGNDLTITNGIYADIPATLDLNLTLNGDQTFTSFSDDTNGQLTIGNQCATRTLDLGTSNLTIDNDSSCGTTRIDANMTGSGQLNITGSQNFTVLSKDNSAYSGAVSVSSGGYLQAQNSQSLGTTGTGTTVASGAVLSLPATSSWGDNSFAEPITVGGTGTAYSGAIVVDIPYVGNGCAGGIPEGLDFVVTLSGTITLTSNVTASTWLDGSNVKLKLTGQIVGAYGISVESGSELILEIASTNNGSTTQNGTIEATPETVNIAEGDSLPSTSLTVGKNQTYVVNGERGDATVGNGGILKGTGTVGDLTVNDGGTVAPGESPGCLTAGNTTMSGNFDVELGGTTVCTKYDQLVVNGTVDVTGATLNTSLFNGYQPSGGTYIIISNDGTDAVTGTFAGLAEGATVTVNGYNFRINYGGGDGNDVVLTFLSAPATPEAGVQLLLSNPLSVMLGTTLVAGAILVISRKYNLLKG